MDNETLLNDRNSKPQTDDVFPLPQIHFSLVVAFRRLSVSHTVARSGGTASVVWNSSSVAKVCHRIEPNRLAKCIKCSCRSLSSFLLEILPIKEAKALLSLFIQKN